MGGIIKCTFLTHFQIINSGFQILAKWLRIFAFQLVTANQAVKLKKIHKELQASQCV